MAPALAVIAHSRHSLRTISMLTSVRNETQLKSAMAHDMESSEWPFTIRRPSGEES
jgi:hypothetical protein